MYQPIISRHTGFSFSQDFHGTPAISVGPRRVVVVTALGVDVPYVAAVTLLRRFSRHRHDYQATGLASASPFQYAVDGQDRAIPFA